MIKNEASRILSLATSNLFTKEEWEKLKIPRERSKGIHIERS
jgi:hypothetical protein